MLNMGNIRPGGRHLAVDDASGLLVAGMLERMGGMSNILQNPLISYNKLMDAGQGKLITICHTDSPPAYPIVGQMNFDSSITDVLISLNWATAEEDYTPSKSIQVISVSFV